MHAIKLRAAVTNRKMKDVVADAITSGLAAPSLASNPRSNARGKHTAARRQNWIRCWKPCLRKVMR
jgi:hypothetical protein